MEYKYFPDGLKIKTTPNKIIKLVSKEKIANLVSLE